MPSPKSEEPSNSDIYRTVWRLDGRLDSIAANVECIRVSHEENGKTIAAINERCAGRKRQISDLYNRVGMAFENTGEFKLNEVRRATKWKTIKMILAGIVATGGLTIALIQLLI